MKLFKSTALIGVIAAVSALPLAVNASQEQITNGSLTIINNHSNAPLYVKCGNGDQPTHSLLPIQGYGKQVDQYLSLDSYFGNNPGQCVFYSDPTYTHQVAATMVDLYSTPVVLYPLPPIAEGYAAIITVNPKPPYNSTILIG